MYKHFFSQIEVMQEGKESLPCCGLCGIHITAGRLTKHQRTQRCNRNTQIQWRGGGRRDRKPMRGSVFQPHGGIKGVMY